MCVAVPGRVLAVEAGASQARVAFGATERAVDVTMTPDVQPGDWVITHSGFALRVVSADHAAETLRLFGTLESGGTAGPESRGTGTDYDVGAVGSLGVPPASLP